MHPRNKRRSFGRDGKPARKKYSILTATITIIIATNFDILHHGLFPTWRNDVINDDPSSRPLERAFLFSRTRIERKTPSIVTHRYDEREWMFASSFTNEKKSYGESIMGIEGAIGLAFDRWDNGRVDLEKQTVLF